MEEYEVSLGDYIRVLWQEKWVVIATFVAAVGMAAIYTLTAPNVFQAEAVVTFQPAGFQSGLVSDVNLVAEWTKDYGLLTEALTKAAEKEISPDWLASHLKVQKKGNFVSLKLTAPMEPLRLKALLQGLIIALQARGNEEVKKAVEAQLATLNAQRQEIQQRLSEAQQKVAKMQNDLEKQRDQILLRISDVMNEAKKRNLALGSQTTLEGYQVMKELDLLYARLEAVETEMDKLSRMGIYALPQAGFGYANFQLEALEAKITEMQSLLSHPSPVVVIKGPWASSQPIGPQRKLTLAVAGILGLFLSVFLAFVVHYVREKPTTPSMTKREPSQPEP